MPFLLKTGQVGLRLTRAEGTLSKDRSLCPVPSEVRGQKPQRKVPGSGAPESAPRTAARAVGETCSGETCSWACVCPFTNFCPVLPSMHFEKDQLSEGGWPTDLPRAFLSTSPSL